MEQWKVRSGRKTMGAKVARGSHWSRLFRSRHFCLAATGANRWSDRRGRASHPTRATATRWIVRQRRRTSTSEGAYQTLEPLPQQHSGQRRRAGTSEGADQAQVPPAQRHSGHRCRASASEGADQTPGIDPRWNPGHRRWAGAYQGLEQPLLPLASVVLRSRTPG